MTILGGLITLLVLALLVAFAAYLVSLRALPTTARPRTRTFDRYGDFLAERENPDYHENPGEDSEEDPDIIRASPEREPTNP
jgi:hypothetical protein